MPGTEQVNVLEPRRFTTPPGVSFGDRSFDWVNEVKDGIKISVGQKTCECGRQKISFTTSGLWILGYLLFVWLTPAPFDIMVFIIPLLAIGTLETAEAFLIVKNNKTLK